MVMSIILFMGAVSGAHLNPAVTLGFALRGDFPWRRVPGYIVAELLGSTLAVLFLWVAFGKVGSLGATEPGPGISDVQAMSIEAILTVGLFSVILGTASRSQNLGPLSALAVGAYIILAGLWSSPISGASMNPARSFGPDLVLGDFSHYWVYVVGPLLGAAVAVGLAFVLRSHADVGGAAAAQGGLERTRRGRRGPGASGGAAVVSAGAGQSCPTPSGAISRETGSRSTRQTVRRLASARGPTHVAIRHASLRDSQAWRWPRRVPAALRGKPRLNARGQPPEGRVDRSGGGAPSSVCRTSARSADPDSPARAHVVPVLFR